MATINASLPTLLDQAKRLDPNGNIATVVEAMEKQNALLQDMVWQEGNLPTGHRVTTRTGLPSVGWRKFNEGVASGKSKTDQFDEACGMLAGMSKVDVQLAKLNGNEAAFRMSEDVGFMQSLNIAMEYAMFYESTKTSPERILGLSPRFDSIASPAHPYANQIIDSTITDAVGSDNTSAWLVVWGPDTVFGIYPKGSNVGIEQKDMGEQLVSDGTNQFRAYVTDWIWKCGLCVKDARAVVRLANIDTTNLVGTDDTLVPDLIRAVNQVHNLRAGRPVIYVNRKIMTYLQLQARTAVKNSTLSIDTIAGQPVTSFMGIPVRMTDALINTEGTIA